MRRTFANETAARFSDLDKVILQLASEGEIEVLTHDGKVRSSSLTTATTHRQNCVSRYAVASWNFSPSLKVKGVKFRPQPILCDPQKRRSRIDGQTAMGVEVLQTRVRLGGGSAPRCTFYLFIRAPRT